MRCRISLIWRRRRRRLTAKGDSHLGVGRPRRRCPTVPILVTTLKRIPTLNPERRKSQIRDEEGRKLPQPENPLEKQNLLKVPEFSKIVILTTTLYLGLV